MQVKKIIKYAFSGGQPDIKMHRKIGGDTDVDVSFQYLKMFFEPDDAKLESIRVKYSSGDMLTGELKAILVDKVNAFLSEHQKKRMEAKDRLGEFLYSRK